MYSDILRRILVRTGTIFVEKIQFHISFYDFGRKCIYLFVSVYNYLKISHIPNHTRQVSSKRLCNILLFVQILFHCKPSCQRFESPCSAYLKRGIQIHSRSFESVAQMDFPCYTSLTRRSRNKLRTCVTLLFPLMTQTHTRSS